jgi:hypothetical protein
LSIATGVENVLRNVIAVEDEPPLQVLPHRLAIVVAQNHGLFVPLIEVPSRRNTVTGLGVQHGHVA